MELKPCKIATAVSLIFMLLLLTIGGQGTATTGDGCSLNTRSRTFQGDCQSRDLCAATCRDEGYADGYCFMDVADPDHRVCLCTAPCPPANVTTAAAATSRGRNMV